MRVDNLVPCIPQSSPWNPLPEPHLREVSGELAVEDEELDRLRNSLQHAYERRKPFTKRFAKAIKDRIYHPAAKRASIRAPIEPKKTKDVA